MNTAATAIEISPKPTSSSRLKSPRPAAAQTCCVRRIPRNAQFSSAPDSSAEMTDGDSLCASGNHVCSGASPILVP